MHKFSSPEKSIKFLTYTEEQPVTMHMEVELKSSNTHFTYSQIVDITNNFEKKIGKGGSGTVYHGSLSDNTQVAVKLLSSSESSKQFQTEARKTKFILFLKELIFSKPNNSHYVFLHFQAELLMRVHHRNLASFIGYCNE